MIPDYVACSVNSCDEEVVARGLCSAHWQRLKRYGDVKAHIPIGKRRPRGMTPEEVFRHYMPGEPLETGCWLWTGPVRGQSRYGDIDCRKATRVRIYAHRFSYEYFNGPIPDGMVIRHACDVPRCVQPDHLLIGTQADNNQDAVARGRNFVPPPRVGASNPKATLTEGVVIQMRLAHAAGKKCKEIAEEFGASHDATWCAVTRRTWKHVD